MRRQYNTTWKMYFYRFCNVHNNGDFLMVLPHFPIYLVLFNNAHKKHTQTPSLLFLSILLQPLILFNRRSLEIRVWRR